jgi:murein DD-endopeptidase MepM/ murein hydrolase activator NlpD
MKYALSLVVLIAGLLSGNALLGTQGVSQQASTSVIEPVAGTPTPIPDEPPVLAPIPLTVDTQPEGLRPPPYRIPLQLRPEDHFWFARPIASGEVNWPNPEYRYGGNYFDDMHTHSGIDISAPIGHPVLAAADGEVVWAGYGLFGHYLNRDDPYGMAVSVKHDFGFEGKPVYTAYAHMRAINVKVGQHVRAGEQLGEVGATGKVTGAHLHFEVRVGEDSFFATRNPELWLVPPQGWGVVAGRIESVDEWAIPKKSFTITSLDTGRIWHSWTYIDDVVHPDDDYNENFVVSDLPAGYYRISVWVWWMKYDEVFQVLPGQTTFLLVHSGHPMQVNPTPPPATPIAP